MAVRIQLRRDTLENWSTNNPVLAEGCDKFLQPKKCVLSVVVT